MLLKYYHFLLHHWYFIQKKVTLVTTYLNCFFVPSFQMSCTLGTARHNLLPALLDTGQKVLDDDHVLFLAEVFQVCACLVQTDHLFTVGGYVFLQCLFQVTDNNNNKTKLKLYLFYNN